MRRVRVHPDEYLMHLRMAHGVPGIATRECSRVPVAELDSIARQTVRGAMKMAGAEGAGLGFGGFATIVPDLGILSAITMRMVQKLSLIYGFQFNTDEEVAELWIAAATAAGVDISKELLERTVLKSFVQRVIGRIAARFSAEFAEKAVARAVPILSSAVGAVLNYYFVRAWGESRLMPTSASVIWKSATAARQTPELLAALLASPSNSNSSGINGSRIAFIFFRFVKSGSHFFLFFQGCLLT